MFSFRTWKLACFHCLFRHCVETIEVAGLATRPSKMSIESSSSPIRVVQYYFGRLGTRKYYKFLRFLTMKALLLLPQNLIVSQILGLEMWRTGAGKEFTRMEMSAEEAKSGGHHAPAPKRQP
jgi:hypothetical protein